MLINNNILLDIGHVSFDDFLGRYYQDFTPAIVHFTNQKFVKNDLSRIPFFSINDDNCFNPVLIIQLGLISLDLLLTNKNNEYESQLLNCLKWLDDNKILKDDACFFVVNEPNQQYALPGKWISGMYQGQAMSLYLRAFQYFNNIKYLFDAERLYNSFKYGINEGGFMRRDKHNCIWFEEYPTKQPSFVLNGFIYAMFGILDLYRVTKRDDVKELWDECVHTLEVNLHKYDVWYWSVYDQLKKQLVSYYYQKNVHIPLMKIMYALTDKPIFDKYAKKWERNLNNPVHRGITKIMYRVQPRMQKLKKLLGLQKANK